MNQDLGLKNLGEVMRWDDERSREEFRWLRLMACLKYDGYRDFQADMRFIESLSNNWLQQFEQPERETAYAFVRSTLVYIGPNEMQSLVEQYYPHTVRERDISTIAKERNIPAYSHRQLPRLSAGQFSAPPRAIKAQETRSSKVRDIRRKRMVAVEILINRCLARALTPIQSCIILMYSSCPSFAPDWTAMEAARPLGYRQ